MAKPTVKSLLAHLDRIELRIVETCRLNGVEVCAKTDGETVTLSMKQARAHGLADGLVHFLIHELIHGPEVSHERIASRYELTLFKSRALREACLVAIANAGIFGEQTP